ncbi:MAG: hypothetical protein HC831_20095 [Chloroflexia bacterium]|nr:hypothetical protein [Chloroflexia bacterium]
MYKKTILLLTLFGALVVNAQNKNLVIEYTGKQALKKSILSIPEKHRGIWDYNDSVVAYQSPFRESSVTLAPKQTITYKGKQFDVETLMGTLIAPKAGTLVKYGSGDPLYRAGRHKFKVIYYDLDKGTQLFELPHKYRGAGCSISENGLLAMSGRLVGYEPMTIEGSHVSLYDKNGKEIFTKPMGSDNWVRDIQISSKGNYIALVYTTLRAHPPKERFNLMILRNDGTVIFDKRYYNTYFHHLIFSPEEDYFLGIEHDYVCLFDLKKQKLLWEKNKSYRTIKSPVIFFKKQDCIVLQTHLKGIFTLHLLNIGGGEEVFNTELTEKQTISYNKTLFKKNDSEFFINSSGGTYNFKIKTKE